MIVYCTFRFIDYIKQLSTNNSYSAVLGDVCDYLKDKNVTELHITKSVIHNASGIYSLNKYRIQNSISNKGKSSSYRCICACHVEAKLIILDTIYPKTGSEAVDNLSKEAYKEIAKSIKNSLLKKQCCVLDVGSQKYTTLK